MNSEIELKNDKITWFEKNKLSKKERQNLIDKKVEKLYNQIKFNQKAKEIFLD